MNFLSFTNGGGLDKAINDSVLGDSCDNLLMTHSRKKTGCNVNKNKCSATNRVRSVHRQKTGKSTQTCKSR